MGTRSLYRIVLVVGSKSKLIRMGEGPLTLSKWTRLLMYPKAFDWVLFSCSHWRNPQGGWTVARTQCQMSRLRRVISVALYLCRL